MWSSLSRFIKNIFSGKAVKKATPDEAIQAFKAQVAARLSGRPPAAPQSQHRGRGRDFGGRPPRDGRREGFAPPRQAPESPREDVIDPALYELFKPKKLDQPEESEPRTPFAEMPIDEEIQSVLRELGFVHSTPVQKAAIPDALDKKNLIVSAMTGSGKTLAFVIPMIQRLKRGEIHQALILSPTREIAIQTHKAMEPFFQKVGLTAGLVIGGTDMSQQKKELRNYPPIIVATPGRLCDMMSQGLVWLNYTDYVVLDEADRMLDMGFEEELMKIYKDLPGTQQVLLFTATLMPEVLRVAEKYGSNYAKHMVGKSLTPADTISHYVVPVAQGKKFQALLSVLRMHQGRTIIFYNTIKDVIHFTTELKRNGFMDCAAIHSGKTQEQRNQSIVDLREGHIKALLGTDVAARGIDIPQVELVINFDLPNNSEEYIHRIGRTGRAGYTGTALSFLGPKDGPLLESIESILKTPIPRETRFPFAIREGEGQRHSDEADRPRPHHGGGHRGGAGGGRQGGPRRHGGGHRGPRREGGAPAAP